MSRIESLSVVVPAYNSELSLPLLSERLRPVLENIAGRYELILVNDGSRDRSWEVIQDLAQKHGWIRGFQMMRNYGQHNALLCGIRAATGSVVITMDDDLQHPPEEIPKLLDKLDEGFDVVYGIPEKLPHSLLRNMLSRGIKRSLSRAMGIRNIRDISAFRAFRTDLRRAFACYQSPNLLLDVLLSWGTTRFTAVAVRHDPRPIGRSNYTFAKLFNQTMLIFTGFSTEPLRIASLVGFAFTLFGVLVFLYVVTRWLLYGSIPGFPFLASLVSLFSGAQLFALGILGEYLARMFHRTTERPVYVIGETTDGAHHPPSHLVDAHEGLAPASLAAALRSEAEMRAGAAPGIER
jgi:undecaprenyl-phosphate 4-deoxy-4-formamido-L-arabinose transferase